VVGARTQEVHHVGAVVALPLLHESLGPEDLLGRAEVDVAPQDLPLHGVAGTRGRPPPRPVPRAVDQVHEQPVLEVGLGQPVGEGALAAGAGGREHAQGGVHVAAAEEEIEVLRVADDSRVGCEGIRPSHQGGHARLRKSIERPLIDGGFTRIELLACHLDGVHGFSESSSEHSPGGPGMGVSSVVRVGAVADLHYRRSAQGELVSLLGQLAQSCDVLLLPGDLTDRGTIEEAQLLARDLAASVKIPVLAVLGNHDFESEAAGEVGRILADAGILVLDGDAHEVHGIGFVGVKGFAGGFGKHALGSWGEPVTKLFVREALDEALKLEKALARLRTAAADRPAPLLPHPGDGGGRAARDLHVPGIEPPGGAADALSRHGRLHGHAHRGAPEGATANGVPVYNVSLPLLQRLAPGRPPVRVLEIAV
jgi:hypothetical protein